MMRTRRAHLAVFPYHTWLVRCHRRQSQTLWSGPPVPLGPRWTSAPARFGSAARGTASLCSSHWRLSPAPHRPPTGGWLHLQSIQSPPLHPPQLRPLLCHILVTGKQKHTFQALSSLKWGYRMILLAKVSALSTCTIPVWSKPDHNSSNQWLFSIFPYEDWVEDWTQGYLRCLSAFGGL